MRLSRTLHSTLRTANISDTSLLRTQTQIGLLPLKNRMSTMDKANPPSLIYDLSDDGTWKVFTGDQLGAVFAAWVLRTWKASGNPLGWYVGCDSNRR